MPETPFGFSFKCTIPSTDLDPRQSHLKIERGLPISKRAGPMLVAKDGDHFLDHSEANNFHCRCFRACKAACFASAPGSWLNGVPVLKQVAGGIVSFRQNKRLWQRGRQLRNNVQHVLQFGQLHCLKDSSMISCSCTL